MIFSINNLDETLPAPWEWDVKRLAASFVVACRDNGLSAARAKGAVMTCVRTYREFMAEFSRMKTLGLWYTVLDADELVTDIKDPKLRRRALKRLQKERGRSVAEDIFPELVERKGEMPLIKDQLPAIFHHKGMTPGGIHQTVIDSFAGYRDTLPRSYRSLLDRYEMRDAAMVEAFGAAEMNFYASWYGRALALSHARSGSSALLSRYMGKSDAFEQALASFSIAYADQNEKDHAALKRAIRAGKIKAQYAEER